MANMDINIICVTAQTIVRRRLLVTALISLLEKKRKYKKRRFWVSDFISQRKINGAFNVTVPELLRDSNSFINYCRMSRELFEELLTLIAPKIEKITALREPIEPAQRLLLTLR